MANQIANATLLWDQAGEPYSEIFQDRYFSSDHALAESHHVFIEQNNLIARWHQCITPAYVIGETGFGSGLNFLAVCHEFKLFRQKNPDAPLKRLYFISFEKYPLTRPDLIKLHQRWPQLEHFTSQLQDHYPSAVPGCHRLNFTISDTPADNGESIMLDLWFGDIADTLPQLSYPPQGLVDCWLLDGFVPSKNPAMWSQTLYQNIAKVTKQGASLATSTATGDVHRGLTAVGFTITKVKGFGENSEMIIARFNRTSVDNSTPNWFNRPVPNNVSAVTIVGGGVASAALCLSLAKRGINITLICRDPKLAQGASGNRQGGFYPLINTQHDYLSQLYSQAFFYSAQTIKQLASAGHQFGGEFCGALQLAYNPGLLTRYQALHDSGWFPDDFLQWLSAEQASEIANVAIPHPALYFPQAAWLCPAQVTQALVAQAKALSTVEVIYNNHITELVQVNSTVNSQVNGQVNNQWQISLADGKIHTAQHLVLANGHQLTDFAQTKRLPLYQTSGQVSHIDTTEQLAPLKTLLCYKGYLTPVNNKQHCIGASFDRDKTSVQLTIEEQQHNIEKLLNCTKGVSWPQSITPTNLEGKVGIRLSAKDHLPMVGGVPNASLTEQIYHDLARGKPASKYPAAPYHDNLYMIGALGSRGLCSAALLGEILACQLTGEPQPVSQALLNQLNPNRYWIKQLKRGKAID